MSITNNCRNNTYEVFISYYRKTGKDFAQCLKEGLKDANITSFRDEEDIPQSIKEESDEFRTFIDKALANSKNFFLIMTIGFNVRQEVLRELKNALQSKKQIYLFRHEDIGYQDLKVIIDGNFVDLSKYEITSFKNENDLIRKGLGSLYKRVSTPSESYFLKEAKSRILSQGQEFKNNNSPMVEIVLGSTNPDVDWLFPTKEDSFLISHLSYDCNVTCRRKFFECDTRGKYFLQVEANGFFHTILPSTEERGSYYIDILAKDIYDVLAYVTRIYEFKNHKTPISILIILRNFNSKPIFFLNGSSYFKFSFANQNETEFFFEFDPAQSWKGLGELFIKIFKELCTEMGCIDIEESTVKKRVFNIVYHFMEGLRIEYRGPVILPMVDINLFGVN